MKTKISADTLVLVVCGIIAIIFLLFKLPLLAGGAALFSLPWIYTRCKKKPELLIELLILFNTRFFSMAPDKIGNIQLAKLEVIILIMAYLIWILNSFRGFSATCIPTFVNILWSVIPIVLIAAVMAHLKIQQSIMFGIQIQMRLLIVLTAFPVIALMNKDLISFIRLRDAIEKMAVAYCVILVLQFMLHGHFAFMQYEETAQRLGRLRISTGYMLVVFGVFIIFQRMIKRITVGDIVKMCLMSGVLIFIIQTRMVLFGVAVSLISGYIICSNFKKIRVWRNAFVMFLVAAIGLMSVSGQALKFVNLTANEITNLSGNYAARLGEIEFFTKQVDHTFLGRGYISPKTQEAEYMDSKYGFYSITDIGIFGLYTTNGLIGLLWYLIVTIILILYTLKVKQAGGESLLYFAYIIYSITVCMTLLSYYYNSEYLTAIFVLLTGEYLMFKQKDKLLQECTI